MFYLFFKSRAIRGHRGSIEGRRGRRGPSRVRRVHTGSVGGRQGPLGAIWGRWPQGYFSPGGIVYILIINACIFIYALYINNQMQDDNKLSYSVK